jgi:outer membrane protein
MKNITPLLIGAFLVSFSMTSFAQTNLKIGYVDITKIMESLPAKDSAAAVLEKESKEMQATYDEMTTVYNKLFDDYQKEQAKLSDIVRKTKEAELLDKEKRIQEFGQNASASLQKRNSELIQPIMDKILKAINKVAAENSFSYILDVSKGSVVYTSKDSENINPLVMKVLKP